MHISSTIQHQNITPKNFTKPLNDSWRVGEQTFQSTQDLVESFSQEFDSVEGHYRFSTRPDESAFTPKEITHNTIGGGLEGAVYGGVGGLVVGGGALAFGGLVDVANTLMGSTQSLIGSPLAVIGIPVAIGMAVGATFGAKEGRNETAQAPKETIPGVFKMEPEGPAFYPKGDVQKRVLLSDYAKAKEASLSDPEPGSQNPLWNSLRGAAVGAALVPGSLVPLVGLAAPAAVGSKVGEALDSRTSLGRGIGLFAGASLTVAGISLINSDVLTAGQTALWAAGALGLTGAALGHATFSRLEQTQPQHQFGEQWWNTAS